MDPDARGLALIHLDHEEDRLELEHSEGVELRWVLGAREPLVPELLSVIRSVMGRIYPELNAEVVGSILAGEEHSFLQTLTRGLSLFDGAVTDVRGRGGAVLPGDRAFELHDTYGFPLDLTQDVCRERDVTVDVAGVAVVATSGLAMTAGAALWGTEILTSVVVFFGGIAAMRTWGELMIPA